MAAAQGNPVHPIEPDEFAALIEPLGPFGRPPRLAVACSGGPDSLALTLLAQNYVSARGGDLLALIVDHRLRPESQAEAQRVAGWLAGHAIHHRILPWLGEKPAGAIQEHARRARYRLLTKACVAEARLHLLLAHHREDQVETMMIRLVRGSGIAGLGAMAAVSLPPGGRGDVRLLRPLIGVARARLRASLEARSQPFIDDPSNADARFLRVRMRALLATSPDADGLEKLARGVDVLARMRAAREGEVAGFLAEAAILDPLGFIWLDPAPLRQVSPELLSRALAAILRTVAGHPHGPRTARLDRLAGDLMARKSAFPGATLGGCRLVSRPRGLLVCREAAALAGPCRMAPGAPAERGRFTWDGRFEVSWASERASAGTLEIRALGPAGRAILSAAGLDHRPLESVPAPARASLPALFQDEVLVATPLDDGGHSGNLSPVFRFAPPVPLTPVCSSVGNPRVSSAFTVV